MSNDLSYTPITIALSSKGPASCNRDSNCSTQKHNNNILSIHKPLKTSPQCKNPYYVVYLYHTVGLKRITLTNTEKQRSTDISWTRLELVFFSLHCRACLFISTGVSLISGVYPANTKKSSVELLHAVPGYMYNEEVQCIIAGIITDQYTII